MYFEEDRIEICILNLLPRGNLQCTVFVVNLCLEYHLGEALSVNVDDRRFPCSTSREGRINSCLFIQV